MLAGQRSIFIAPCKGQTEVENLHGTAGVEDQIGWLDIAVDKTLFVGVLQADRRLPDVFGNLPDREWAVPLHLGVKVDAIHVFHGDEVDRPRRVEIERADDVGMIEPGRLPGLALEPGEIGALLDPLHRQHLDGRLAVERGVPRVDTKKGDARFV